MIQEIYNPNRIIGVCAHDGTWANERQDTGFQEYPKTVQLWQKVAEGDGRIFLLKTWRKSSIMIQYEDKQRKNVDSFEQPRPYIKPK